MCTVTYIPASKDNGFILTSNRDEKDLRPTEAPEIYLHDGIRLAFPKDKQAGGSWIAANERGRLCCLLNGAYIAHVKQNNYVISRGKILLSLVASSKSSEEFFREKSLKDVEPFTIICIDYVNNEVSSFHEFVWDGEEKHSRALNTSKPYIWSSATLYTSENRQQRNEWFSKLFQESNLAITPEQIFSFHSASHTDNEAINVLMKRSGGLKTVSITQVMPEKKMLHMHYADLLNNTTHQLKV